MEFSGVRGQGSGQVRLGCAGWLDGEEGTFNPQLLASLPENPNRLVLKPNLT